MNLNHLYVDKLCARLQCWDAEIRRWNDQAATAAAGDQPRLAQQLQSVSEKRDLVQDCLLQLRSASSTAWHIVKTGMEAAWFDLTQAIEQTALIFDT